MLIAFNKPFGVLSQFTPEAGHRGLNEFALPKNVYAAGRLDHDSEGLLLLSDQAALITQISHPKFKWPKVYWAQVDGELHDDALTQLQRGVALADGPARAQHAERIAQPDPLWPRDPPIRVRKLLPTSWLQMVLQEGRNRQVRRMTAAVGLPTLRLIRAQIGPHVLGTLQPGEWRQLL